ncbi:hypothetical protein ACFLRP_03595 [Bacteroidota bacterium]
MNSTENRIKKLEKQLEEEASGHEMLIEYCNGNITRFYKGEGPPWQTTTLKVAYEQDEDKRKAFENNVHAIFNGEGTE